MKHLVNKNKRQQKKTTSKNEQTTCLENKVHGRDLILKLHCHIYRIKLYNRNNGIAFYPRKHRNQSVHAHVSLFFRWRACVRVFMNFGQTHFNRNQVIVIVIVVVVVVVGATRWLHISRALWCPTNWCALCSHFMRFSHKKPYTHTHNEQ